jgi:ketosteroid isomerase-like protein
MPFAISCTVARFFAYGSSCFQRKPAPMQEEENIDLVKKVYSAFGKGDIDTIIDSLADQLVWRFDAPSVIPYAGEYDTPNRVKEGFFGSLASTQKGYALKTDEFIAQNDKVIMVGSYGATVNDTGKRFDLPLVHVWTIQNGKVKRFVNFTDTAKVAEAYTKD